MKHPLETVFGTHMVQFPEEIQRAQKRLPDVHTYEGFFFTFYLLSLCYSRNAQKKMDIMEHIVNMEKMQDKITQSNALYAKKLHQYSGLSLQWTNWLLVW